MYNLSCLSQAWRHMQCIMREQVRLVPLSKVAVAKLMRPSTGVLRDAQNAVFLGQAPESIRAACKGGTSASATGLVTSGQASARVAMKTREVLGTSPCL